MANSAVRFRSVLLGVMMVATVHGRDRSDAVDLADVRALTFRRGQMTASRRVAAVPQVPLFLRQPRGVAVRSAYAGICAVTSGHAPGTCARSMRSVRALSTAAWRHTPHPPFADVLTS